MKMKKLLCMVLCAMLVLSLVACGKPQAKEVDLAAVAAEEIAVIESSGEVLFPEENPEVIESLYPGLTAVETKQLVVYLPPIIGFPCEIVMVEAAAEEDAEAICVILQNRINAAADDTTYPENAEGWKNRAEVYRNGSFVVMTALPEGIERTAAMKAEF